MARSFLHEDEDRRGIGDTGESLVLLRHSAGTEEGSSTTRITTWTICCFQYLTSQIMNEELG